MIEQADLPLIETVRQPAARRAPELGLVADSVFCSDLADCPPLKGPLFLGKSGLLVNPDFARLALAYADANWRWTASVEDHPTRGNGIDIMEWLRSGKIPSEAELRQDVAERVEKLGRHAGDYIQFGGMTVFRTNSGGVGLALDWLLVEHYRRTYSPNTRG